jgi:hypothetical protein
MSREFEVMPPTLRKREAAASSARIPRSPSSLLAPKIKRVPQSSSPLFHRPVDAAAADAVDELSSVAKGTLAVLEPVDIGLRCVPRTLHIAGFQVGIEQVVRLRVRNVSPVTQRLTAQPISPSEDDGACFRVEAAPSGRLAPGLEHSLLVRFTAVEARYHYAALRVAGDAGELLIPLHAYPVPSALSFPSRVDFGRARLGQRVVREVVIDPRVPIPFDFAFTLVGAPQSEFEVSPESGLIPPGGHVTVTLAFAPSALNTARTEWLLATSAAGPPAHLTLVGSAAPGQARDEALLVAVEAVEEEEGGGGKDGEGRGSRWNTRDPGLLLADGRLEAFKSSQEAALLSALEARSGIVDAMEDNLRRATGVRAGRAAAIGVVQGVLAGMGKGSAAINDYGGAGGEAEGGKSADARGLAAIAASASVRVVNGVRLPPRMPLGSQKELDYVLRQREGKTGARDVRLAVAEARQAREGRRAAQVRLRAMAEEEGEGEGGTGTAPAPASPPAPPGALAPSQAARRAAALRGPALPPSALAATEVSTSWLYPALAGLGSADLHPLLSALESTPDETEVDTGGLLDEALTRAGGTLRPSAPASLLPAHARLGAGLPPVLAALVRAAAAPLTRPRALRSAAYSEEMSELSAAERAREGASYPWAGEALMSAKEAAAVKALRTLLRALEGGVRRRLGRVRRTTIAVPAGGLRAVISGWSKAVEGVRDMRGSEHPGAGAGEAGAAATLRAASDVRSGAAAVGAAVLARAGSEGADPFDYFPVLSHPVIAAACLPVPAPAVEAGATHPGGAPTFSSEPTSKADAWGVRRDAVGRFREAIATAVVRLRVERRTRLLEGKIAGAGGSGDLASARAAVSALVEAEAAAAALEGEGSWVLTVPRRVDLLAPPNIRAVQEAEVARGPVLRLPITSAKVTRGLLPVPPPAEGVDAGGSPFVRRWDVRIPLAFALPVVGGGDEAAPFAVEEGEWPWDAAEGYTPFPLPSVPMHAPVAAGRAARAGAQHETAATGLLPLPSSQPILDPSGLGSGLPALREGAGVPQLGALAAGLQGGWAEHPAARPLPPGCAVHGPTGLLPPGLTSLPLQWLPGRGPWGVPPDPRPEWLGFVPPHAAGAAVVDAAGGLATLSVVTGASTGGASLRYGAPAARLASSLPPSLSRPPVDVAGRLLEEEEAPPGPPRLPTAVTPLANRLLRPLPPPPAADPWLPGGLPALLAGPAAEDLLSDDSESDPEREEFGGGAEGSAVRKVAFAEGGASPRAAGGLPSMDAARALFRPAPGGTSPATTLSRDRALLDLSTAETGAAWAALHGVEATLLGKPMTDAGEAAAHPPRLGAAHVLWPRGAGNAAAAGGRVLLRPE